MVWVAGLALVLAGCGGQDEEPGAAPDPGPQCQGQDEAADGIHVLRGGFVVLPGGGAVTYAEAEADGTSRSAVLADGRDAAGRPRRTVTAGQTITVSGHAYTVAQICTYRVVLTSTIAGTSPSPDGDDDMTWPTTVDGRWRLPWHIPARRSGDNGLVVVATEIYPGPAADISVRGSQTAFYEDTRVGDTVEIADQLWRVEAIDANGETPDETWQVVLDRLGPA